MNTFIKEGDGRYLKSQSAPPPPGPSPRHQEKDDENIHDKWPRDPDGNLIHPLPQQKFEPDSIVKTIIERFETRAEFGFRKYGNTLDRTDITVLEWIQHIQDELHDGILYLEKLKQVLGGKTI